MSLFALATEISDSRRSGVALKSLADILQNYDGSDWKDYCCFSDVRYKRNQVYSDDLIEIVVICWKAGQKSGIHDHPVAGCLARVLSGCLMEEIWKKESDKLSMIGKNELTSDLVSYQEGDIGLHNIINSFEVDAVSLHVYSPPGYVTKFYQK